MQIYCPNCALQITVEETLMGSKGQCPKCSHKFVINTFHRHPPMEDDLGTAPTIKIEEQDDDFDFDLIGPGRTWLDSNAFTGTLLGFVLLIVAVAIALWTQTAADLPSWGKSITALHPLFAYGGFTLLAVVFLTEVLGNVRRFEHLRPAIPFLMVLTLLFLFLANVSGAFSVSPLGGPFSGHWWLSLIATLLATAGLICSLTLAAHPDSDRHLLVIVMALAIGVLMVSAYMGHGAAMRALLDTTS